jgi:RNA 2',3'-cyclic 3'-phosphodiesterase
VADGRRARLFVALELPGEVQDALVSWGALAFSEGHEGVRLLRGEDLHVTLCFLGWQETGSVGSILAACGVAASLPDAFLTVKRALWLPPRQPRVLAVSLEDLGGRLSAVQAVLARALAAGRWYVPEKRPFLAHVTVARVRGNSRPAARPGSSRPAARPGSSRPAARPPHGREDLEPPPPLAFPGTRVVLYRSRLGRDGARYEALGDVVLSPGPRPEAGGPGGA